MWHHREKHKPTQVSKITSFALAGAECAACSKFYFYQVAKNFLNYPLIYLAILWYGMSLFPVTDFPWQPFELLTGMLLKLFLFYKMTG